MRLAGIAPAGALTAVAALPIQMSFGPGAWSRAGALAIVLAGVAFIGTAVFPWTGAANDLSSLSSKLHLAFALAGFLLLALGPLFFGLQARRPPARRGWSRFSLATSALVFALAFLLPRPPYLGAFQRAALAAFYLWLVAVCWQAWRDRSAD
jgi:hypothetical protein